MSLSVNISGMQHGKRSSSLAHIHDDLRFDCRAMHRQNDNGFVATYVHGKTCILKAAASLPEAAQGITAIKDVDQQEFTNYNIRVVFGGTVGSFGDGDRSCKVYDVSVAVPLLYFLSLAGSAYVCPELLLLSIRFCCTVLPLRFSWH